MESGVRGGGGGGVISPFLNLCSQGRNVFGRKGGFVCTFLGHEY
jgi:hypothetical protein